MAGRGWLLRRLAQKNATDSDEPPKPLDDVTKAPILVTNGIHHTQLNNIEKTQVSVLQNGTYVQECDTNASVSIVSNGFHVQESDNEAPISNGDNGIHKHEDIASVSNGYNGIHKQENVTPVSNGYNGIHKEEDISIFKAPVPVLTNGIQPLVIRGRRALTNKVAQSKINDIETGFSSMNHKSQPFLQCQTFKTGVPKTTIPTTQGQLHSMVSLQNQPVAEIPIEEIPIEEIPIEEIPIEEIPIEEIPSEEIPHEEYRVNFNSKQNRYVMKQFASNYIRLEVDKTKGMFEYHVKFDPEIDAKPARMFLINQHRQLFPIKIFNGDSLFVPTMLPNKITVLKSQLKDESEVTIKITFIAKCNVQKSVHFYNIVLHSIMKKMSFVQFHRSFYDPTKKISVEKFRLEIWPGFITAIDEYDGGLFMCCDLSHRVLRLDTVLEAMSKIGNELKNKVDIKDELMSALCGLIIITRYNNTTYRIDDIDFDANPTSTFNKNGQEVSYVDYYKQMYDIQIHTLNQPMLISMPKRKDITNSRDSAATYLVPELCYFTGLSEKMKENFNLMKAIHSYTTLTPDIRQKALFDFVGSINANEDCTKHLDNWGLKFLYTPINFEGPVYKREFIKLGNEVKVPVGSNMDWGVDISRNKMFSTVKLMNWAILYINRDVSTARAFCHQLSTNGKQMGMIIESPTEMQLPNQNPGSFDEALKNVVRNHKGLQLIVLLFSTPREDSYNTVKRICCGKFGIPSQVIISRTLSKPERLRSITQKIALQINCKLGGAGWKISIPLEKTMIIGIDVYHEKRNISSSVVGFVASVDQHFTRWYSSAIFQKSTYQEISNNLYVPMINALNKFKEFNNGTLPNKIIVYRDGISHGQLKIVEENELNSLYCTIKSYSEDYYPQITFITVQKRINTKIFQVLDKLYYNPNPGSVIDNTVTKRNVFDFFLVSQHSRQGTVTPTHYIVLKNECKLSIEQVQLLSYKLCHLYFNWSGTIKVPAPVQYAHKLAYLIGQNMKELPNEELCDTLFYL